MITYISVAVIVSESRSTVSTVTHFKKLGAISVFWCVHEVHLYHATEMAF